MSATDIAQAAVNVVTDPRLGDVASLLNRLHEAEQSTTPTAPSIGIGLCKVVPPLKAIVFIRENPIVGLAAVAGFFGIFVGIGYKIGKKVHAPRGISRPVIDV